MPGADGSQFNHSLSGWWVAPLELFWGSVSCSRAASQCFSPGLRETNLWLYSARSLVLLIQGQTWPSLIVIQEVCLFLQGTKRNRLNLNLLISCIFISKLLIVLVIWNFIHISIIEIPNPFFWNRLEQDVIMQTQRDKDKFQGWKVPRGQHNKNWWKNNINNNKTWAC